MVHTLLPGSGTWRKFQHRPTPRALTIRVHRFAKVLCLYFLSNRKQKLSGSVLCFFLNTLLCNKRLLLYNEFLATRAVASHYCLTYQPILCSILVWFGFVSIASNECIAKQHSSQFGQASYPSTVTRVTVVWNYYYLSSLS